MKRGILLLKMCPMQWCHCPLFIYRSFSGKNQKVVVLGHISYISNIKMSTFSNGNIYLSIYLNMLRMINVSICSETAIRVFHFLFKGRSGEITACCLILYLNYWLLLSFAGNVENVKLDMIIYKNINCNLIKGSDADINLAQIQNIRIWCANYPIGNGKINQPWKWKKKQQKNQTKIPF